MIEAKKICQKSLFIAKKIEKLLNMMKMAKSCILVMQVAFRNKVQALLMTLNWVCKWTVDGHFLASGDVVQKGRNVRHGKWYLDGIPQLVFDFVSGLWCE